MSAGPKDVVADAGPVATTRRRVADEGRRHAEHDGDQRDLGAERAPQQDTRAAGRSSRRPRPPQLRHQAPPVVRAERHQRAQQQAGLDQDRGTAEGRVEELVQVLDLEPRLQHPGDEQGARREPATPRSGPGSPPAAGCGPAARARAWRRQHEQEHARPPAQNAHRDHVHDVGRKQDGRSGPGGWRGRPAPERSPGRRAGAAAARPSARGPVGERKPGRSHRGRTQDRAARPDNAAMTTTPNASQTIRRMPQTVPNRVPSTSSTIVQSSASQNDMPAAVAPWKRCRGAAQHARRRQPASKASSGRGESLGGARPLRARRRPRAPAPAARSRAGRRWCRPRIAVAPYCVRAHAPKKNSVMSPVARFGEQVRDRRPGEMAARSRTQSRRTPDGCRPR